MSIPVLTDSDAVLTETSVASTATVDLGAVNTRAVVITGTTAISSFGTRKNRQYQIRFAGNLTITYNSTTLILPGNASLAVSAGDTAIVASDASGNWRMRSYHPAATRPIDNLAGQRPGADGAVTAAQFMAILNLVAPLLPTALPSTAGVIWNNGGVIQVS